MQTAAEMLSSGHNDGSITDIAHLCGFRDPLYFSRMFKKKYNVSPKEYYRQRLAERQSQQET